MSGCCQEKLPAGEEFEIAGAGSCCGPAGGAPRTPCCSTEPGSEAEPRADWLEGSLSTPAGEIPVVATALRRSDRLGAWRVRWGIGRMRYRVTPGLYAIGRPTPASRVLVSANYKLSFDRLRSQLAGRDAWILVLDTRGVNVWCAAGKGTFGTDELVARASSTRLAEIVEHRKLIVPQLGATGVSAPEVKKRAGWRVVYGPVRAEDLPAFLDAGEKATAEMRRVRFPLRERIVLIPVEGVQAAKITLAVAVGLLFLSGLGLDGYSWARVASAGLVNVALLLGGVVAGVTLVPALLPWLPGRAFALKGAWVGGLASLALVGFGLHDPRLLGNFASAGAWWLFLPAVTSFLAMNFTGCSTYTSLSGVRREMRVAIPLQIGATVLALGLWITGLFL